MKKTKNEGVSAVVVLEDPTEEQEKQENRKRRSNWCILSG
jgi:hypothetical protein